MKDDNSVIVSFIVPVYKTPNDILLRCLESIFDAKNITSECIMVVDGDGEFERYKAVIKKLNCSGLRLIDNPHGGVNAARNRGLKEAKGTWICFVDSDDAIISSGIDRVSEISEDRVSLCTFNHQEHFHAYVSHVLNNMDETTIDGDVAIKRILLCTHNAGLLWGKLFRRSFLERRRLWLDEHLAIAEDCEFMLRVCAEVSKEDSKILLLKEESYKYYRNIDSVTKRYDDSYISNYVRAFNKMKSDLEYYNYSANLLDCFVGHVLIQVTSSYVFNVNAPSLRRQKCDRYNSVVSEKWFSQAIANVSYAQFSKMRAMVFACWKHRMFSLLQLIAWLRQMQFRIGAKK